MDKAQFAAVQNAAKAVAAEATVAWLAPMLRSFLDVLPADARSRFSRAIQDKMEATKAEYLTIAIRGYPAAISDLIAGEFQDAFAKISEEVQQKLGVK